MLVPGSPSKKILFVVLDSTIPTQRESLQYLAVSSTLLKLMNEYPDLDVVKIDLSSETLPEGLPLEVNKVKGKNSPSFILRTDESLHNIKSGSTKDYWSLRDQIANFTEPRQVNTVKDFVETLKSENKKIDDFTMAYFDDKE